MPDYEMVPRALRSFGETLYRGMSDIGASRLARERLNLVEAKTEFDVGEAKEKRRFRTTYEEPLARRKLEKIEQERAVETAPVTFSGEVSFHLGPSDPPQAIWIATELPSKVTKGLGLELDEKGQFTKRGVPVSRLLWNRNRYGDQLYTILRSEMKGMKILERMSEDSDPEVAQAAKEAMKDPMRIHETDLQLLQELRAQSSGLLTPEADKRLAERIKEERENIKLYRQQRGREKVARITAKAKDKPKTTDMSKRLEDGTVHKEGKIVIGSKRYDQLIRDGYRRGTLTGKPTKDKKKPGATEFNTLYKLVENLTFNKVTEQREEPTKSDAAMINEAAKKIGWEYKHVEGPIRKRDKRWYWSDPDKKSYWTLRKAEAKPDKEISRGLTEPKATLSPTQAPMGKKMKVKITQPKTKESTGWKKYLK